MIDLNVVQKNKPCLVLHLPAAHKMLPSVVAAI